MKKITFTCLLISLASYIYAQDRVIERPPFITRNTNALEIEKITLSEKETILDIKVFSNPKYWIKIASESSLKDDKGDVYPIRSGEGITLDKEFYTPQSGEASIQLFFDPIPKTATSIDFIEGYDRGAFRIWGIQLQGNTLPPLVLPEGATVHQPDMNADLPEPQVKFGKAILKGKALDYKEGANKMTVFLASTIKALGASEHTHINDKGEFLFETDIVTVTPGKLQLDNVTIDFIIAPGEETEIIINLREMSRRQSRFHRDFASYGEPIYYNGYLASVQQELATNKIATRIGRNYEKFMADIGGMSVDEVTEYVLSKLQEISQTIAEAPVSKACKELLQADAELSAAQLICTVNNSVVRANAIRHNIPRDERSKYMQANWIELPASHFNILKEKFPIVNQPKAMYAYNNAYAITTFMYMKDNISKGMGTDQGILFENIACKEICMSIQEFVPLTEEQKAALASLSSPGYLQQAEALNRKLTESIERNKSRIANLVQTDLKEVVNEDLYTAIVAKHRGKVVLIDIWATWCSPCRMANEEMAPLKEEWKDKDFVFVYIAGENSPLKLWENMIVDIHGEHHRLTNDQYSFLMESFNATGVPTYIVVDKGGGVSRVITGYPGVETIKKALLKAAE